VVALVQVHKDHSVPDGTPYGLRRPPRPPQTPVRPDVLVVVPRHDNRLSEHGHHQRVTAVGDGSDQVDEVPAGAVGCGHFSAERAVVGRRGHTSASTGLESQPLSAGNVRSAAWTESQPLSGGGTVESGSSDPPRAPTVTTTEKTAASTDPSNLARIVGFVLTRSNLLPRRNKTMAHSGTSMPQERCIMFLHVQDPGGWRNDNKRH